MKSKIFISVIISILMHSFYSQNLLFGQGNIPRTSTIKPGMARIYFNRGSGMLGAIATHVVIDRLDSANFNAYIEEKKIFTIEEINFTKARNIKLMYLKVGNNEYVKLIGKPQEGDKFVNRPFFVESFPLLCPKPGMSYTIPGPLSDFLETGKYGYCISSNIKKLNCRIVGAVNNGGSFFWDRPAGIMLIQNITSGGDQAFAHSFTLEAGKTYNIDYHYAISNFIISEK
jgi:hypothetical protein